MAAATRIGVATVTTATAILGAIPPAVIGNAIRIDVLILMEALRVSKLSLVLLLPAEPSLIIGPSCPS